MVKESRKLLIAALAVLTAGISCAFASGPELMAFSFKPGMPQLDSTLTESVTDPAFALRALKHNLAILNNKNLKKAGVKHHAVGSTDSKECTANDCYQLSLRRAQLVHNWLINHGASPEMLAAPIGYGADRPIDSNDTESGRFSNRTAGVIYEL